MHCDRGDGPSAPDTDEYNTVSKMFAALLAALHPSFPMFLVKMVESAAVFYSDPNTDKVRLSISGKRRKRITIFYTVSGKIWLYGRCYLEAD